jgi:transposase
LFTAENEVLLYDVTSTYFEGQAEANPQAQRGYSRDRRPDCKQVCIAVVVTFDGSPWGMRCLRATRTTRARCRPS